MAEAMELDLSLNQPTKNPLENPIVPPQVEQENQDLGFVGTPKEINQSIIERIVKEKKVPVIAPLGLDKDNQVFSRYFQFQKLLEFG